MIIGVDGNEANVEEKVGVSVYSHKLLEFFQKKSNKDVQFLIFLKRKPRSDLPAEKDYFKYQYVPGDFLWSQTFLPLELFKKKALGQNISVFFSPAHYAPRFCPVPIVVTIHDLSFFYYPEEFLKKDFYQLKNWTKYSVEKARKIIAVSQTTKKDITKFYKIPEEKIEVIYEGYEKKSKNLKLKTKNLNSYILYVGTIQPRKNIETLIEAFSVFRKQNPGFKLLIVGKKGWLYEHIYRKAEELRLNNSIKFLGYVSDTQLSDLYKKAFCFVLPSFYEGFGIPVIEAMSFGCPVISSFTSSLPEIGGDACLYFDPKDPKELAEKLTELKDNQSLRNELIKKGKKRIKLFSWQRCSEKTLEILVGQNKTDGN